MPGSARRVNRALARVFPDKRLFLRSAQGTAYLRLTPLSQLGLGLGGVLAAAWLSVATATLAIGLIYGENEEVQAVVLHDAYQARLAELGAERDTRAAEARSAQNRFQIAMEQIGRQQTAMLRAVEERRELSTALGLMRGRLQEAVAQRDGLRAENGVLREEVSEVARTLSAAGNGDLAQTLETIATALGEAVRERDTAASDRTRLNAELAALETRLATTLRRQDEMMAEIEYAVRTSLGPLQNMLEAAELDVDSVIAAVRRDFSGTGGGGGTVSVSTRSFDNPEMTSRFDELMVDLDRVNMLRIAAGRIPYTMPVSATHRFTSPFGYRRDPKTGGRRMHAGIDLAAPRGTPIYATADGVVTSAGMQGGYGNTIRIRHAFGFETLYAHHYRIHVKVGQQVSRGDHIGDMGSTGRVTGVHLHYEVHLNGKPVNPMVYLEAASNVF
ncbi:DUF5930 domain-containing protein [soil metagenome]